MDRQKQAQQWRKNMGFTGKGGVVVLFQGQVSGWMNQLRDPQGWEPGCIAVDEQGRQWEATGGDSYNGAENWHSVHG